MAPPTFGDLGKSAKDLFSKGYNFGFVKVETTTKAGDVKEVEFKTTANHNLGSGKLAGNLDVKYKVPKYGITLTEKWNTENQLGTVIEVNEQFGKGLKLTFDSVYAPHAGKRSGKLKADWALPTARITADVALTSTPVVNAAAVFARDGWLFGASGAFDTGANKLANSSMGFGYQAKEYTLHSYVLNNQEFGASLFHKVANNVELGAQLAWKVGGNGAAFAVATKYAPNKDVLLRAKLNSESQIALAATHSLSQDLKLTLSTQFNLANDAAHKFGLGVEFVPQ